MQICGAERVLFSRSVGTIWNVIFYTCFLSVGFAGDLNDSKCNDRLLFNSRAGAALPMPVANYQTLLPYFRILQQVAEPPTVKWSSDLIVPDRRLTAQRAGEIVQLMRDPNGQLNQDVAQRIQNLGGIQSPRLWDEYFRAYDKIVGFTQGFWDIALAANAILPTTGVIADLGSGTGNITTILAMREPNRMIRAYDFSLGGLSETRKKLQRLGPGAAGRHATIEFDLTKGLLAPNSLDGAVMNNVLYTLGDHKAQVLRNIFQALKPGAPFVLSDVHATIQRDFEVLVAFLSAIIAKAVEAGSPVTEYDMVFSGAVNLQVLMSKNNFLTSAQLEEMASQAGFRVEGSYKAYYGGATFLHLVKPE